MTRFRSGAVAFRWSVAAVFVVWLFAGGAAAQVDRAAKQTSITGVYNGTYTGDQGAVKFKLSVTLQNTGLLTGSWTLYLGDGADAKEYTCRVTGRYVAANRMFQVVRSGGWDNALPAGVVVMGMNGVFDPDGGKGAGQISGKMRARPAPEFQAVRDADESAKLAAAAAVGATPGRAAAGRGAPVRSSPQGPEAAATSSPPAPSSPAPVVDPNSPAVINGVYSGEFKPNESRKLKLWIKASDDGSLAAVLTYGPSPRRAGPSVTYKLTGKYDAKATTYGVGPSPYQFTSIEPVGSAAKEALEGSKAQALHIGINGPGSIVGRLTGSNPESGEFSVASVSGTKDRNQPADLDQAMSEQAGAAARPAAEVAAAAAAARLPVEGVYNGTYAAKGAAATKFKLMLWVEQQSKTAAGKVIRTDIAGLLTIFPSDDSGVLPCVGEVRGFYGDTSRVVQLTSRGWEPRMPGVALMNGLEGKFDPAGGGQISGAMTHPTSPEFTATKEATESAAMDVDRLRNHIYPHIVGVFNGTYTRANEPATKLKLTVKHNRDGPLGLDGLATIYLPSGSGATPYTYGLKGVETGHGEFQLMVQDWVSPPPADFKNFRGMGFNGKVIVNEAVTSATMVRVAANESMAQFYLPQFEATWDAKESGDLDAAIVAQKSVGKAGQSVALKARDEMIKNAQPKELASTNLVRKSRKYWDAYRHDMIREVFDGGFGGAMDEDREFQRVFCTYVEMFSAKCADCLPPNHVRVTNVVRTNRKFDQYHNLTSEEVHDYTVDMDPRFEEGYKRCWAAVNSKSEGLAAVVAAAQPGGVQHVLYDLTSLAGDMQRFFADHGGKSAAMRQMNENFVRAINGELSLQQSGGTIDGAEAESDKDLPPGKYARLVDGANAYFIAKAKADPLRYGHSASHDTALCQRMGELFTYMSPEEEYYYANDFGARFVPIMGPRAGCPDPAWPTFHPDVEKAIAEVK